MRAVECFSSFEALLAGVLVSGITPGHSEFDDFQLNPEALRRSTRENVFQLISRCHPSVYCKWDESMEANPVGSRDLLIGVEGWASDVMRNNWLHMVPPKILREAGGLEGATAKTLAKAAREHYDSILHPALLFPENATIGRNLPPVEFRNGRSFDVELMRRLPLLFRRLTNDEFDKLSESMRSSLSEEEKDPRGRDIVSLSRYAFDRLLYETICEHSRGLLGFGTDCLVISPGARLRSGKKISLACLRWAYNAVIENWRTDRLSLLRHGEAVAWLPKLEPGSVIDLQSQAFVIAHAMAEFVHQTDLPCYSEYLHGSLAEGELGSLRERELTFEEWNKLDTTEIDTRNIPDIDETIKAHKEQIRKVLEEPYACQDWSVDQLVERIAARAEMDGTNLSNKDRRNLAHICIRLMARDACSLPIATRLNVGPGLLPRRLNVNPCFVPSLRVGDFHSIPLERKPE